MVPNLGLAKAHFAIKNKSSVISVQAAPVVQYFQNANGGNSSYGFTVGGITFNADPTRREIRFGHGGQGGSKRSLAIQPHATCAVCEFRNVSNGR